MPVHLSPSLLFRQLTAGLLAALCLPALGQTTITYPASAEYRTDVTSYPLSLLQAALKASGKDYVLKPSRVGMVQARGIANVEAGNGVDVMWTVTSEERERKMLPIRIPIDRGLMGWRLLLVKREQLEQFGQVSTLAQLAPLQAIQGRDWPDTQILKANGLSVRPSSDTDGMFVSVLNGRADYFPRSLFEIWDEEKRYAAQGLVVEPRLMLHYPSAMYYFVNRKNTALANDLTQGLESMLADGSLQRLFQTHFGAAIKQADIKHRLVLNLENPGLPADTPLKRKALWLQFDAPAK